MGRMRFFTICKKVQQVFVNDRIISFMGRPRSPRHPELTVVKRMFRT